MIITRTPFRISFFGGGTDYPLWFREHGGAVLGTTFNKYCYISCRYLPPFFDHRYRIAYSRIENAKLLDDIEHPAVRAVLQHLDFGHAGLEIHYDADLPARSGLGSSSSFTVGLLSALKALRGEYISGRALASLAIHVEQEVIGEAVGSQDQTFAACGGFNQINFHPNGSFDLVPVVAQQERMSALEDHLMLFFTGFSRFSTEIAESQMRHFAEKEASLHHMRAMVDEGLTILQDEHVDITKFGELLHDAWKHKRGLSSKVSTKAIDDIYIAARDAGAIGGKILGAGGGGFMLLFVEPSKQQRVRERLANLLHIPFKFEKEGSRVVLYQPDGL